MIREYFLCHAVLVRDMNWNIDGVFCLLSIFSILEEPIVFSQLFV